MHPPGSVLDCLFVYSISFSRRRGLLCQLLWSSREHNRVLRCYLCSICACCKSSDPSSSSWWLFIIVIISQSRSWNLCVIQSRGSHTNDGDGKGADALLTGTNWLFTLSLLLCVQKQMRWRSGGHAVLWSVLNIDVRVRSFLIHILGIAKSRSEWAWISCCGTIIFFGGNVSLSTV